MLYRYTFKLVLISLLGLTSCTRYQGTATTILDDLGVSYEVVETIPSHPHADALYTEGEDKIYVKKGRLSTYLLLHELVHKVRFESGDYTNPRLEEIIAVKAAFKIAKIGGIPIHFSKYQVPALITRTLRANGIDPRILTEEERYIIEREVDVSVELFEKLLNEKGHSLKQVDWVKTAILLLL